jgi:hypothetical protein
MSLRIRSTALAAIAAGALTVVFGAPAVAAVVPIAGSPISVYVGDLGQLQAHRDGDSTNIFFSPGNQTGDAGFFLAFPAGTGQPTGLDKKVFGFTGTAGPFMPNPYLAKSQQLTTGTGTEGDPFKQVTTYAVNAPAATGLPPADLVLVTQTTTYVNGKQTFNVRWDVKNQSGAALRFKALSAADFYFEGSDVGTGIFTQGPPRFVGGTNADTGRSGGFIEILSPSTSPAWSHYQALRYSSGDGNDVWTKVEKAADAPTNSFDDTVLGEPADNAGGVEWDQYLDPAKTLAPNAVATFELTVRTSAPAALQFDQTNAGAPQGVPITITATAKDTSDQPFTGKLLRWAITGANPGTGQAAVDAAGHAAITDPGANAGADTIVAYVDLNNNSTREANEPQGSALATFVDKTPPTCKVSVSGDRPVSSGGQGKPLVITVNCDSVANVVTNSTLTIKPAAAKKAGLATAAKKKKKKAKKVVITLPRTTATVQPNQALPIKIAIPAQVTKKYPGATATATVSVIATDQAGNVATTSATKTVKIAKAKKKAKKR